jgi:transcriptional regulator with XRE-family HTH domain
MSESKLPSGIDRLVGQRLRWRRRELRLTQEKLGELLSLTFQQVQKYEKGVNRISAGRLYEIAAALGVQVAYFYDGASELLPSRDSIIAEEDVPPATPILSADTLELIAAFQSITDPSVRKSILTNVSATANALGKEPHPAG